MHTLPAVARRRPTMTSANSRWPLPATPAIPTISPRRTSREAFLTASYPSSWLAPRAVTDNTTSPVAMGTCLRGGSRSRPTIYLAKSSLLTFSGAGLATTREDFHQGRLPHAVFPHERVDFSSEGAEIDPIVGQHSRKTLGDAAHFHQRRRAHVLACLWYC